MTNLNRAGYDWVTISKENESDKNMDEESLNGLVASLEDISWYHGPISRTAAETLLRDNDIAEGTYLLRKSQRHDGYSVSVRVQGSVKHFVLDYDNRLHEYKFGNGSFPSLIKLLIHFQSCPVLTKENDIPVTLIHPYNISRDDEPSIYDTADGHAEAGKGTFEVHQKQDTTVASKSGYLVKRGNIRKSWKERWFTSERKSLKYYENRRTDKSIKELDLTQLTEVAEDTIDEKKHCFRLVFPNRTFYFMAKTPSEEKSWIDHFQWKIDHYKKLSS